MMLLILAIFSQPQLSFPDWLLVFYTCPTPAPPPPAGLAVLNLPVGFALDLGTRTLQQGRAVAGPSSRRGGSADAWRAHGSMPHIDVSSGKRGG